MIRTNIEHLYESTFLDKNASKNVIDSLGLAQILEIHNICIRNRICTQSIPEVRHACDTNTQKVDMNVEDTQ